MLRHAALLLLVAVPGLADEPVPYTVEEIDQLLKQLEAMVHPRVPEEDAVVVMRDLAQAHQYLASKGKHPAARKRILDTLTAALRGHPRRMLQTLECARALGKIGDPAGDAPLRAWLGGVLAQPAPYPQYVEHGFVALARIAQPDGVEFLRKQAVSRQVDAAVAIEALQALRECRRIEGDQRRGVFRDVLADIERRQFARAKGARLSPRMRSGLETLVALRPPGAPAFRTIAEARAWWKTQAWPAYMNPGLPK